MSVQNVFGSYLIPLSIAIKLLLYLFRFMLLSFWEVEGLELAPKCKRLNVSESFREVEHLVYKT